MPLSPLCVVSDNGGPYLPTTGGIDVSPSDPVQIQLANPTGVAVWYLTILGTDELTSPPTLTNVNPGTGQVTSPTSIVSFTYPGLPAGRAILFQSTVVAGSNSAQTTFTIYSLTPNGDRVGAVGETREGNVSFGWAALLNPILRSGASYLYYNDSVTPHTGSTNIQGALDYLKTHSSGGGTPPPIDENTSFTVAAPSGTTYRVDATSAVVATLPTSPHDGDTYTFIDPNDTWLSGGGFTIAVVGGQNIQLYTNGYTQEVVTGPGSVAPPRSAVAYQWVDEESTWFIQNLAFLPTANPILNLDTSSSPYTVDLFGIISGTFARLPHLTVTIDSSGGPFSLILAPPAAQDGYRITVTDPTNSWAGNNVTVSTSTGEIVDPVSGVSNTSIVLSNNGGSITLVYSSAATLWLVEDFRFPGSTAGGVGADNGRAARFTKYYVQRANTSNNQVNDQGDALWGANSGDGIFSTGLLDQPFPQHAGADIAVLGNIAYIGGTQPAIELGGTNASITTLAGGILTITGLSGMLPAFVNSQITISGAGNTHNNGTFLIAEYFSSTSIGIPTHSGATAPDTQNGFITWSFEQAAAPVVAAYALNTGRQISTFQPDGTNLPNTLIGFKQVFNPSENVGASDAVYVVTNAASGTWILGPWTFEVTQTRWTGASFYLGTWPGSRGIIIMGDDAESSIDNTAPLYSSVGVWTDPTNNRIWAGDVLNQEIHGPNFRDAIVGYLLAGTAPHAICIDRETERFWVVFEGQTTGESGTTGSFVTPPVLGVFQFTDSVGGPWSANDVGRYILIQGAATPANNGTFLIVSFTSATQIGIQNPAGNFDDNNNGSLIWSEYPNTQFRTIHQMSVNRTRMSSTEEQGFGGSISTAVAGVAQFTDPSGGPWSPGDVGLTILISGAASQVNNGTFSIVSFTSATQIGINNPNAVSDANNGSLSWIEYFLPPLQITDLNSFAFPAAAANIDDIVFDGTYLWGIDRANSTYYQWTPTGAIVSSYNLTTDSVAANMNSDARIYSDGAFIYIGGLTDEAQMVSIHPGTGLPFEYYRNAFVGYGLVRGIAFQYGTGDLYAGTNLGGPAGIQRMNWAPPGTDYGVLDSIIQTPAVNFWQGTRLGARVVEYTNYAGVGAAVTDFTTPTATISGLGNLGPSAVGSTITFSGAFNPANNGSFPITNWLGPGTIQITNGSAVADDDNNGSIFWALFTPAFQLSATPLDGSRVLFVDLDGYASTNPLAISSPNTNINGQAAYSLSDDNGFVELLFDGGTWLVVRTSKGADPGFSDNASEERTRREGWLRRNEFVGGGEGSNNTITLNTNPHIAAPLVDFSGQVAGNGIAILGDKVFFVGTDSEELHGALYGVDLFVPGGGVVSTSGSLHGYGDAPTDFIGVRGMSSSTGERDCLFGIFPNSQFAELGRVSGTAPSMSYTTLWTHELAFTPQRACFYAQGGGAVAANPLFFMGGDDGNIYVTTQTGVNPTPLYGTGDLPGAMFVDDAGFLWVLYTTSLQLVKFSITLTGANPLSLVVKDSIPMPSGTTTVFDVLSDGRYARVLARAGGASGVIYSFDLQSGVAGPTLTPVTGALGSIPRLAWDGVSLYFGTGGSSTSLYRLHPMTGEILFDVSFGSSTFTRGMVVQDAGTLIVGTYATASGLNLGLAAGGFENRNFNSIGILGRPLSFLNGGQMQNIIEVTNSNPGVFDEQHSFAACNTTSGTCSVTFPSISGLPAQRWMVAVWDFTGNANNNPITINSGGVPTENPNKPGSTTLLSFTLSEPGCCVAWIYDFADSMWKVYSYAGPIPVGANGAPTNRVTWDLLMGQPAATTVGSSTPQIVGSNYFDIQTLQPATGGYTREVFFKFILATTNASDVANIDLIDVNNVLGGGAGAEVTGSNFTTTNTTPTYFNQRITALEPLTTGGIFQVRVWLNPQAAGQQVICYMAKLDVEYH